MFGWRAEDENGIPLLAAEDEDTRTPTWLKKLNPEIDGRKLLRLLSVPFIFIAGLIWKVLKIEIDGWELLRLMMKPLLWLGYMIALPFIIVFIVIGALIINAVLWIAVIAAGCFFLYYLWYLLFNGFDWQTFLYCIGYAGLTSILGFILSFVNIVDGASSAVGSVTKGGSLNFDDFGPSWEDKNFYPGAFADKMNGRGRWNYSFTSWF